MLKRFLDNSPEKHLQRRSPITVRNEQDKTREMKFKKN